MTVDVKKYKFGVIGYGFLGSAITHGFGLHADIKIHDKYKDYDTLEDVVNHADVIWMCLPTPMDVSTGAIDLSILHENLLKIDNLAGIIGKKKTVVIKSTVVPGTTRSFANQYTNLNFVANPEFLTARNNKLDFICASRIILGGNDKDSIGLLEEIYKYRFGNSVPIYKCEFEEAELTKYGSNCFFALKISYFNYLHDMCSKLGIEFDKVRDMILADGRIGRSHANVPGWDGKKGYSGACFPKDINALIAFSKDKNINPKLLSASWSQNLEDRPEQDWKDIESAVNKKEVEWGDVMEAYENLQPLAFGEDANTKFVEVEKFCNDLQLLESMRIYFRLKAANGVNLLESPDIPNCPKVKQPGVPLTKPKDLHKAANSFWASTSRHWKKK